MRTTALIIALALATTAHAETQQFGLDCVGIEKSLGEPDKPWRRSFSFDLTKSVGSVVGSGGAFDIVVTESQIRLLWGGDTIISRSGGFFSEADLELSRFITGSCKPTTFTPFPKKLF